MPYLIVYVNFKKECDRLPLHKVILKVKSQKSKVKSLVLMHQITATRIVIRRSPCKFLKFREKQRQQGYAAHL